MVGSLLFHFKTKEYMKILVTSGGTKIPIDKVRDITNMSKGTFGSKIATELLKLGHEIIFFKAKNSKSPFKFDYNFFGKVALAQKAFQEYGDNPDSFDILQDPTPYLLDSLERPEKELTHPTS